MHVPDARMHVPDARMHVPAPRMQVPAPRMQVPAPRMHVPAPGFARKGANTLNCRAACLIAGQPQRSRPPLKN
jgi:hypothetical protein